jgi:hypothetical protein
MFCKRILRVAACGSLLLAGPASAVPLFLDFTSTDWGAADGSASASLDYGSLSVTLTASGGLLSFNASDAASPTTYTGILALGGDGIGIGDDEIGFGESLGVSFSSAVTVLSFELLDLFPGEGPDGSAEQAAADFGAAGIVTGSALATDYTGYYGSIGLDLAGIQSIGFASHGGIWSDFALAGIWVDYAQPFLSLEATGPAQVPEPGSLALLGLSLIFLASLRAQRAAR